MRLAGVIVTMLLGASVYLTDAASRSPGVLLVAGGTGRTGQHVVRQALEQGYDVRILARDVDRVLELFGDGVGAIEGDVRDPATLTAAVVGVRYVVSVIGSNSRRDPANTPEAVDYRGVKALVEAARAAGVEQFVLVSSMGVTRINHPLNRLFDNILLWKALGENALRYSGLEYTILRPGGLTDDPGARQGIVMGAAQSLPDGRVPRADLAAVCLAALGNPDARHRTVEVITDPHGERASLKTLFGAIAKDEEGRLGGD
jgi:uncharacterized protein YbjT (DUF2867 family)